MIRTIKDFMKHGIEFFKNYNANTSRIHILMRMVEENGKEQRRFNKLMEEWTMFDRLSREEVRKEMDKKTAEMKPSDYDMRY